MLFQGLICTDILTIYDRIRKGFHLPFQTGRKYSKTHDFDQTDIFLFDMVQLGMRMINPKRMFLCRNVIAQSQIQFKHITAFSGDRCDRIM